MYPRGNRTIGLALNSVSGLSRFHSCPATARNHELRKVGDRKIHLPMMRLKSSGLETIGVLPDEEPNYEIENLIERSRAHKRAPYGL